MKKILIIIVLILGCFKLNAQVPQPFRYGIIIGSYASDPTAYSAGQIYWNTSLKKFRQYNGTIWENLQGFTLEDSDSTQIIDIGNIGSNTIEDGFNAFTFTGANDPVQEQADGYVLINCIRNGIDEQYLFLGGGGNYGTTGTETALAADFTLVDRNIPFQDVWRNDAGNQVAINYTQPIRHDGNVTVNKRLIVGGSSAYGIYNTGTSDLWIYGNQGVNIIASNQNLGNINLTTNGLLSVRPADESVKYNIKAYRDFSDTWDTNNFRGINLWLNSTVDFTNKTGNSYHTSLLIDPDIQDTGIEHKAIDVVKGLVDIQSGKLKVNDYTLPNADGTDGQVLTTDGSGNVSWGDAADNAITKTLINASSATLLAADVENFNQFIIDPSQTNVTITIPPTVNPGGMLFLNIYHEGTGNITVQAGAGVTFTTQTFTNAKRVVLYSDTDDVWKVKEENPVNGSEYTNTDDTNGRLRKYIIPSDFDFENIPANYDNAIWEIRYVHDLGGANITLPNNVTLLFNGGRITNYGTITLDETKIDFTATYPIFDASGDFSGAPQLIPQFITPIHFGAVPDDTTDCTDAFNAVSQFVGATKISGFIDQGRPSYTFPLDVAGVKIFVPSGMYSITDSIILRAGQKWEGVKSGTILHFEPTVLGTDLFVATNTDTDNNYVSTQQRYIFIDGFTLSGDVDYDGSGNAGAAIKLTDASFCKLENLIVNKFEYGAYIEFASVAAYYNKFENCDFQQNRQNLYVSTGTAVSSFENCVFVGRPEFTAKYDYNVEVNNNCTFLNCSFEGSSWNKAHIKAPIGKVVVNGGRVEGVPLFETDGRGTTGGVHVVLPNGVTEGFGEITNIDDAPVQSDMNDDQNVLTQNINFGQGVAQELKMLKNQSWKLGTLDWTFDGSDGFYELVNDRANLFGAENGIRIEKTNTTSSYAITQPMSINTAKFYATVWVKKSADADLRAQIGLLYASDNSVTTYFKEFVKTITVGDWSLYVASVAHYYKNVPTNNPQPYLGLTTSSPTGSWAIFSNLRFWAGGYPLFSGSDDNQVNKEYVVSALPTQALLESGDIVTYDGTNASYPLDSNSSKGVICNFNLDTTLDANALDTDTTIDIPDASDVEADDYIGVYKNTGGIHWTTVASVSINTITLTDALDGDADLGNKVYIYRLIPKESSGGASGGSAITAVKTVDQTVNNNNTVALDSELQISLEANSYYDIEVQLLYEADATPDLRTQFEVPTGADGEFWRVNHTSIAASSQPLTTIQNNTGAGVGTARQSRFFVTIYTGINSGTFGVKWAQNTSDAADTTLKRGSSIKAVKLN